MLPEAGLEVVEVDEDEDIECLAVTYLIDDDGQEKEAK